MKSQIHWHGLDPSLTLITIASDEKTSLLSLQRVLDTIDQHADTAALLLLSGVDYRTGQLLDIPRVTAHAQSKGLVVGWDMAHAVGNTDLRLHDWNIDFAVWCCYKYLNCGPGAIAGVFVHERHGRVEASSEGLLQFKPRLAGWWGADVRNRFKMESSKF